MIRQQRDEIEFWNFYVSNLTVNVTKCDSHYFIIFICSEALILLNEITARKFMLKKMQWRGLAIRQFCECDINCPTNIKKTHRFKPNFEQIAFSFIMHQLLSTARHLTERDTIQHRWAFVKIKFSYRFDPSELITRE